MAAGAQSAHNVLHYLQTRQRPDLSRHTRQVVKTQVSKVQGTANGVSVGSSIAEAAGDSKQCLTVWLDSSTVQSVQARSSERCLTSPYGAWGDEPGECVPASAWQQSNEQHAFPCRQVRPVS